MGGLLDRLRGRPRLQPARLKAVWNIHIKSHDEYFFKVLLKVMSRDEGMNEILSPKDHANSEGEREFVLKLLAERIAGFFYSLMQDEVLNNPHELKKQCYALGRQHSAYSKEPFKLTYWDTFTLALLEELESRGGTPREELRAWQALLHIINENMLAGYLDARSSMRKD
ncbi:unnamed protein product [Cylicocyclus nassatus]|uniref:Uncharacterized protein n=1 Tax=Cylicocyclus nassatus TaxID=53992 RepID=A0AA36H8X4_CYLNA|nr:unnamed protein product [Cylicocyclus nassatus]